MEKKPKNRHFYASLDESVQVASHDFTGYKRDPRTEEESLSRAKRLAKFLHENAGGTWKSRAHFNMGWHYSVMCGTISVSEKLTETGSRFHIMNSGRNNHPGTGDTRLDSYHADTPEDLLANIDRSIKEHRDLIQHDTELFESNREMYAFKKHVK